MPGAVVWLMMRMEARSRNCCKLTLYPIGGVRAKPLSKAWPERASKAREVRASSRIAKRFLVPELLVIATESFTKILSTFVSFLQTAAKPQF